MVLINYGNQLDFVYRPDGKQQICNMLHHKKSFLLSCEKDGTGLQGTVLVVDLMK